MTASIEEWKHSPCKSVCEMCVCYSSLLLILFTLGSAWGLHLSPPAWSVCSTSLQVTQAHPCFFISVSTVLLQVSLGLPLFLRPSGVHLWATLGSDVGGIRSTCPIHLHRRVLCVLFRVCVIVRVREWHLSSVPFQLYSDPLEFLFLCEKGGGLWGNTCSIFTICTENKPLSTHGLTHGVTLSLRRRTRRRDIISNNRDIISNTVIEWLSCRNVTLLHRHTRMLHCAPATSSLLL